MLIYPYFIIVFQNLSKLNRMELLCFSPHLYCSFKTFQEKFQFPHFNKKKMFLSFEIRERLNLKCSFPEKKTFMTLLKRKTNVLIWRSILEKQISSFCLFVFCLLSGCLFVFLFLSFCLFVCLYVYLFIFLSSCLDIKLNSKVFHEGHN